MIQRIQTLYILLGSLILSVVFFYFPYSSCVTYVPVPSEMGPFLEHRYMLKNWYSLSFFLLLTLLVVFSFKNLKNQIKLVYILFFFSVVIVLFSFFSHPEEIIRIFTRTNNEALVGEVLYNCKFHFLISPFFFLGQFFYFLAIKAIKKDYDLINSINRLR